MRITSYAFLFGIIYLASAVHCSSYQAIPDTASNRQTVIKDSNALRHEGIQKAKLFLVQQNAKTFDYKDWKGKQVQEFKVKQNQLDYLDAKQKQQECDDYEGELDHLATQLNAYEDKDSRKDQNVLGAHTKRNESAYGGSPENNDDKKGFEARIESKKGAYNNSLNNKNDQKSFEAHNKDNETAYGGSPDKSDDRKGFEARIESKGNAYGGHPASINDKKILKVNNEDKESAYSNFPKNLNERKDFEAHNENKKTSYGVLENSDDRKDFATQSKDNGTAYGGSPDKSDDRKGVKARDESKENAYAGKPELNSILSNLSIQPRNDASAYPEAQGASLPQEVSPDSEDLDVKSEDSKSAYPEAQSTSYPQKASPNSEDTSGEDKPGRNRRKRRVQYLYNQLIRIGCENLVTQTPLNISRITPPDSSNALEPRAAFSRTDRRCRAYRLYQRIYSDSQDSDSKVPRRNRNRSDSRNGQSDSNEWRQLVKRWREIRREYYDALNDQAKRRNESKHF